MNRAVKAVRGLYDVAFHALVLRPPISEWKVILIIVRYGNLLWIRLKQRVKPAGNAKGFADLGILLQCHPDAISIPGRDCTDHLQLIDDELCIGPAG